MPFNGSGTFSIVNTFVPNTTILSAAVNANFSDIATGLSDCLTRDGQAGMTAAFKAISGTVGAPSITFTADATTGLYLISAGNLGLTASGVLQVTVSTAGIAVVNNASIGAVESALVNSVLKTSAATTSSTITSIATSGTGAIAVGSTTGWNTNGYLLADKEIMSYTVASAAGLTINARGQLGTTSISHATGATVTMLYAGTGFNDTLLPARATAGRPTSPAPGDFGFNTTLGLPEVWNGSTWVSTANPQLTPQGYLSTVAGTPILTGDSTAQTSIFYNPFNGNLLPVPNSGVFSLTTFSTAQIDLSSGSQAVNGIYDVYGFICTTNSTLTFGFSPSWAAGSGGSVAAGSGARGTGAGGTAQTVINGLYTNTVAMTLNNGASTYAITTGSGIYLGSVLVSPTTAGTVNCHVALGQNRQWGVWNAFNRQPTILQLTESTTSWTYATATVRQMNGSTANTVAVFNGLPVEKVELFATQHVGVNNSGKAGINIGWGVNIATSYSGKIGWFAPNSQNNEVDIQAKLIQAPLLGLYNYNACENANNVTTNTLYGTTASMLWTAAWRA